MVNAKNRTANCLRQCQNHRHNNNAAMIKAGSIERMLLKRMLLTVAKSNAFRLVSMEWTLSSSDYLVQFSFFVAYGNDNLRLDST